MSTAGIFVNPVVWEKSVKNWAVRSSVFLSQVSKK